MYCAYCGKQISDDAAFCGACGKKVMGRGAGEPAPNSSEKPALLPSDEIQAARIYAGIIGILILVSFMPMFELSIVSFQGQYTFLDAFGFLMNTNRAANSLGISGSSILGLSSYISGAFILFVICAFFWMVSLCMGAYLIYRAIAHQDIQPGGPSAFMFLSITVIVSAFIAQAIVSNAAGGFLPYIGNLVSPGTGAWLLLICSIAGTVITSKKLVSKKW